MKKYLTPLVTSQQKILEARNLAADIFEDLDHLAVEAPQADGKSITLQSLQQSRA